MFGSIENYYEILVFDRINRDLRDDPTLTPDHLEDIACLALNQLKPRYIRNSIDLLTHISDEERAAMFDEVERALMFAVETIRRRHSEHGGEVT
ncbi:MAG: late competence development ComFB family protein [Halothiobacillaceae bacterium]|nr:late competence development ComFB family protein [Halothiobacillaceae bacterium]